MSTSAPAAPIDLARALAIAQAAIAELGPDHDFVVLEDLTESRPFGWVFAYTTRLHRDTGDVRHAVPGNGPVVVETTGKVTLLPTSAPPQVVIAEFERQWRARKGRR